MNTSTRQQIRAGRRAADSAAARPRPAKGERGVALITVFFLALVMAAIVLYVYQASFTSRDAAAMRDSRASSSAAAEYGVDLAIAQITSGLVTGTDGDGNPVVTRDWVAGGTGASHSLFENAPGWPKDQRRIKGEYGDQEFRVRVRSARLAYAKDGAGNINANIAPEWLRDPGDSGFEDVYEITASARDAATVTSNNSARSALRPGATIQTVVDFRHNSLFNTYLDGVGVLHNEKPGNYMPSGDVVISGEDHNINKYFIDEFIVDRIVTPLKLFTNTANFFGAYGGYWSSGYLTLNYRLEPEGRVNPYRPKTAAFSGLAVTATDAQKAANTNHLMIQKYTDQDPDTYLLGGKSSRTVTLLENGVIKEVNNTQAYEGGNFNIVLGAFEDLMNLYINMAGVYGSIDDQTKDSEGKLTRPNWFQQYIGQYTQLARTTTLNTTAFPLYAGNKIRAQTFHVMKNKEGKILVREYEKTTGSGNNKKTTYYKYPESGATWNKKYVWVAAPFSKDNTTNYFSSTEADSKGKMVIPRLFLWQELVGFSLHKRGAGGLTGDPALRNPPNLTTTAQNATTQALDRKADKRTYFRLDAQGDRVPIGFDEEYQKNNGAGTLNDRWDTIQVKMDDGTYKDFTTMDDFLFEMDFGNDADGNPVKRDALCLFIGYEDQLETNSGVDYNYSDMMFNIFVSPQVKRKEVRQNIFSAVSDHWWERKEEEGLTGLDSHPALSTNRDPSTLDSDNMFLDNFNLLAHSGGANQQVYSMINTADGKNGNFPRASFEWVNGVSSGILLAALKEKYNALGITTYYYTEDDLTDVMQKEPAAYYDEVTRELNKAKALQFIQAQNPGYTFLTIDKRWDESDREQTELVDDQATSSYMLAKRDVSIRQVAADIIGSKVQNVPVIPTTGYLPLSNGDLGGEATGFPKPTLTQLGFLAGETLHAGNLLDDGTPAPLAAPGAADMVPHRDLVFKQPDGSETPLRQFLFATPEEGVAQCYVDYYLNDPETREKVQNTYGLKENRYSIGFHRSGTDEKYQEKLVQDHYEIVSLGVKGFNPYREAQSASRYIAKERADQNAAFGFVFKYSGDDGLIPNFLFDKPIDGAGAMVVNGNLIVSDTFAYHGNLVVLGDLIIRPALKENQLIYGKDGNPIDAYGNSLYEESPGKWVYDWVDPDNQKNVVTTAFLLDDDGNKVKDADGNPIAVAPLRESLYRGELIVQGNLITKGRIITDKVKNELPNDGSADYQEYVSGKMNLYWSSTAMNDIIKPITKNTNVARVVSWTNDDNIDVGNLWTAE